MKQESDLLIMSVTTDRIGRHKVLLPVNQDYDKSSERNLTLVICVNKMKQTFNSAKCLTTVHAHDVYCPHSQA